MHRENEPGKTHEEKAAIIPPGGTDAQTGSGYKTAAGITLNFHSAEFNYRDDLNDISGNYRTFEPLDGVVTADMLHQAKLQRSASDAAISGTPIPEPGGQQKDNLDKTINEPPPMLGQFQKPQFTLFRKNHCLHGRVRKSSCEKCLAVCPHAAIQSIQGEISFNHHLCQGCGSCALVCPADAIRLVYPSRQERLSGLKRLLSGPSAGGAPASTLIISDDESDRYTTFPMDECGPNHKIFTVAHIGHIDLQMLLIALIYGAGNIVVVCDPENDSAVIEAVWRQVDMSRAILSGLGQPADRIRFTVPPDNHQSDQEIFVDPCCAIKSDVPFSAPDEFSDDRDSRMLVRLAVQQLYDRLNGKQPSLPLPEGSPFGAVAVDPACTLCMACVDACPSKALIAGGSAPRLEFIESRCNQCHGCTDVCPEGSLHLQPRILCDPIKTESPAVLYEVQAVRCIECGLPFASQAMIDRIQANLTGHPMFKSGRQLSRLQMCRACRTRDALMSEDMKTWNQFQVR